MMMMMMIIIIIIIIIILIAVVVLVAQLGLFCHSFHYKPYTGYPGTDPEPS